VTATAGSGGTGAPLLAGFAEVEITPSTEGVRADGTPYRRSFTVYDPLMARVLVLRQGERVAAVAGLDVFELGIGFDARVLDHLEGSGLTADGLLCCPSHVGMTAVSNYGAYIAVFAQDLVIESYEAECARRVADGIRRALDGAVPVNVAAGAGRAPDILFNRRFVKPDGSVEMVYEGRPPAGVECVEQGVDDAVGVIRFDTPEGDQVGALINFGCHALCSTDRYGHITADYPAYVAALFRQAASLPVVFTQGGLGDVVPIERRGTAARRVGRSVGAAALYAFEQLQPVAAPPLGLFARRVEIPARVVAAEPEEVRTSLRNSHARYRAFLYEWYRQHPTIAYPIKLVTLGDIAVLQLAGEVFHDTALAIKGASPFAQTVVVSRATREVGYVPPPEAFRQGGMEVSLTGIAPASEPLIRAAATDLLRAAYRGAPAAPEPVGA
jgi:hypothetical protein